MRDRRCDEGSGKTVVPLRRASLAEGSGGRNPPFGGHFLIWRGAVMGRRLYSPIRRGSYGQPEGYVWQKGEKLHN